MDEFDLTPTELAVLMLIAQEMRELSKGMATGRATLANTIATRAGVRAGPSMRALLALPDLRRPRPETLEAIARGIGLPDRAAAWQSAWAGVPHPKGTR